MHKNLRSWGSEGHQGVCQLAQTLLYISIWICNAQLSDAYRHLDRYKKGLHQPNEAWVNPELIAVWTAQFRVILQALKDRIWSFLRLHAIS
jgi:hypothetical protein